MTGGATVQTATQDASDPSRVVLTTTAQTLGSQYTLNITGVRDRFNNPITVGPQSFTSSILIDGYFSDWAGFNR